MKKIFSILIFFIFLFAFSLMSSAATYSASVYSDTSYNSSQAMNLYSMYMNSDSYSPFSDYVILRTSQNEYSLVVMDKEKKVTVYTYNSSNTVTDHYTVSYYDNYSISNSSSYTVISNINTFENALRSSTIESYIFQYLAIRLLPLLVILIAFNIFRVSFNPYKKGFH